MRAIVLAAGKGKRLLSEQHDMPKVLRQANGKPLLGYVMDNLSFLSPRAVTVVVGYRRELVQDYLGDGVQYAIQQQQLGTGHAVNVARALFEDYDGPVLVCYGDMPLLKRETFRQMLDTHRQQHNDCTILTGVSNRGYSYGRVVRAQDGGFITVVEERDCTPQQLSINELNVGVYVFDSKKLFHVLGRLKNNNNQGEYYLTDAPQLMMEDGCRIGTYTIYDDDEILGVNTVEDLEHCEAILQREKTDD